MQQKLGYIIGSTGLKQSLLSLAGNTFATGLSAISLILISRMLGPEQFGAFSVGFALIMIVLRVNDFGLNATILKYIGEKASKEDSITINSYTLRIKLIITGIILLVAIIGTPYLAQLLEFSDQRLLLFSFLFGIWTVYYEQLQSLLQGLHLFGKAIIINLIQASVKLISVLIFYFLHLESTLVILTMYLFAPVVPLFFARQLLPKWFSLTVKVTNPQLQQKILSLAKHTSVAFISTGVIQNIDILFVQRFLTLYETGLLGGVSRIALLFSLVALSLSNVLNPRVSRYKEKSDLQAYIKKAFLVGAACILGFFAFIPFGELALVVTVGPEFLPGLNILYILTAAAFLSVAVVPFLALFYTFEAEWYFSVSGFLQLFIIISGNILFVPQYGLEAAAWTRLTAAVCMCLFTIGLGLYTYKMKFSPTNIRA